MESLVACRLIPLNKNPGLIPIEVEKVLRRISGKVVTMMSKQDIMKAAGKNDVRGSTVMAAYALAYSIF